MRPSIIERYKEQQIEHSREEAIEYYTAVSKFVSFAEEVNIAPAAKKRLFIIPNLGLFLNFSPRKKEKYAQCRSIIKHASHCECLAKSTTLCSG